MGLNTRTKKRESVNNLVEFSVEALDEKTAKISIPKEAKESIKSTLFDISVIGCAIDSPYIIPPGIAIKISIDPKPFADELGFNIEKPMEFSGRVRSCVMKAAGHYRLGVQFIKPDPQNTDIINKFIAIKEQRKAPRWNMSE